MSYKNRANFKPLSNFIKRVNVKNKDGAVANLKGINIDKFFMPSVANVIGTDLTKYKVVKPQQFACNRMHVGRDYRLPIAVSNFKNNIIVSPAYDVFEIINTNELNPEYLMMWFSRSEFDRNCWFYTDTDVRGKLGWDSFCEIELPIPSIEKQKEIVKEYNTIVNRIQLNKTLNQKLEETAQALYKHWFVDFEFPNKEGEPYKSSGGKMVSNEELNMEIPIEWKIMSVKDFCIDMKSGGTPSRTNNEFWNKNDIPWLKTGELKNSVIIDSEEYISLKALKESSAKLLPINSVLIEMYGQGNTKGQVGYLKKESATNQACCSMICDNEYKSTFLYYHLRKNREEIVSIAIGGAQPNLSKEIIENVKLIHPTNEILHKHPFKEIMKKRESLARETIYLKKFNSLLLSKMTKVEVKKEMI